MKNNCHFLKNAKIFSTRENICRFEKYFYDREFKKGEVIFNPGDKMDEIILIKEGEVCLYQLSREGKKVIIDILPTGAVLSGFDLDDNFYNNYGKALLDTKVCAIKMGDFMKIVQKDADLSFSIIRELGKKLKETENKFRDLAIASAKEKITRQLVRLMNKGCENIVNQGCKITTKITHENLANMVGLTRETTTKTLKILEEEGVIKFERRRIIICSGKK